MGQEQLNCKNKPKQEEKQIHTTHTQAAAIMRNHLEHEPSQLHSKKSTTLKTDGESTPYRQSGLATPKKIPTPKLTQHQNIQRVAYAPFRAAEKVGSKWVQRGEITLAEIVEGRYNTNKHFPQTQVVTLIESLVYSLSYMQKNGFKHHDYYPTNIYYINGLFKLSNPQTVQASGYYLTQQRQRFSFLSPELIAQLIEETPVNNIPLEIMYKSDLFAIGMVLLQFCSLEQSSECYDQENYSLIDRIIQNRLAKIAKIYSMNIADCIAEMLKYDVDERVNPEQMAIAVFMQAQEEKVDKPPQEEQRNNTGRKPMNLPPKPQHQAPSGQQQQQQPAKQPQQQYLAVPGQSNQAVPGPASVTMPPLNYTYSHIGPNNQSLLSSETLNNKLRAIQQINQNPIEQEESQGQPSALSRHIPSQFEEGEIHGQRIVVHDNNMPPNNQKIQMLHQQIQRQRQMVNQQGNFRQVDNQQFQGQMPPQQAYQQQLQRQHEPSQYIQQGAINYVQAPPQQIQPVQQGHNYQPNQQRQQSQVMGQPQHLPPNYLSPNPKNPNYAVASNQLPQAPSQQNNMPMTNKPGSPSLPGSSEVSAESNMKYEDRMLLMQPTYYQVHGKPTQQTVRDKPKPTIETKAYDTGYSFSDKYGTAKITTGENDYKVTDYDSKYTAGIPSYQSGGKYSTATDFSPLLGERDRERMNKKVDENGETLQQRVDRILQISRSLK